MSHPIFQANENSPYGDLPKDLFYKHHNVTHKQGFILNNQQMKIFTQSWRSDSPEDEPIGVVCMIHGYTAESSWLFELNAVAMAKAGLFVCALDLPGHGYSEGNRGHIPRIDPVVRDCIQFFDSVRSDHPNLPAFLYGESLGGAIAILIATEQKHAWSGLILSGPMCEISRKFKPIWPLEEFLPLAAYFAPSWRIIFTKPPSRKSYKEGLKRKLAANSPNRFPDERAPAATALELLRVCERVRRRSIKIEVPLLLLQGGDDQVCDVDAAKSVFKSASSEDKSLRIFAGMWHQLIGEPNESVELVFDTMLLWIHTRANLARSKINT